MRNIYKTTYSHKIRFENAAAHHCFRQGLVSDISVQFETPPFTEMHSTKSPAQWLTFYLGLNLYYWDENKTCTGNDTIAIISTSRNSACRTHFYILIVWILRLYPINVLVWLAYCSPFNQHGHISQGSYLSQWYTLNWKRTDYHNYIFLWHNSVTIHMRHWVVLVIDWCHRNISIYRYRGSHHRDKSHLFNVNAYTGKTGFYIESAPEYFAVSDTFLLLV